MKKPLIILTGPTAVGKTDLSIQLAKRVSGEIISADSMQVYKYMDIGSAKVRPEEMDGVPHHLINLLEPDEEFHVVRFQEYAKQYIKEIWERGKIPILVGGTGFYIQAVLYDIDFTKTSGDPVYRKELERVAADRGNEYLHEQLRIADPASANSIHANNVKRVIRALEYFRETGEPISLHNEQERLKESPYQFAYFVLNTRRDLLYERIDQRVDQMLSDGLVEEVKGLKARGLTADLVSMQGLGYKEILAYLNGSGTLEEAVCTLKRDTRHFAKRQLTWFKRERDVCWIDKDSLNHSKDKILDKMTEILIRKGILVE